MRLGKVTRLPGRSGTVQGIYVQGRMGFGASGYQEQPGPILKYAVRQVQWHFDLIQIHLYGYNRIFKGGRKTNLFRGHDMGGGGIRA